MHRPASFGRLFGLVFTLAIAGLLFSTRAITDSLVPVTSLAGLTGANDSVQWSQLGADGTSLASTFKATSMGSIQVVGTLSAAGSLTSVVCPASQCSWGSPGSGGFSAADTVIWTSDTANGGTGPLTLSFGTTVKGVGAMIQADGPAQFTARIEAFNGGASLGAFTANSDAGGDAVFVGALDQTAANISSVVFSLTSCMGACSDFAIDTVFLNSTGGGPTPAATPAPTPITTLTGPSQIKFPSVDATGSSKAEKVNLTNKGALNAIVGSVSVPSGFGFAPGGDGCSGTTVAPKKSCTMMLLCSPASPGPVTGTLSAPYNGGTATVSLSGLGTAVSVKGPASVNFGTVTAGTTGPQKLVAISNLSKTATALMGAANLSGPFIKGTDSCSNASIKPNGKCNIGIEFKPTSASTTSGSLGFAFTYGLNPGTVPSITLSGKVK